MGNDAKQSLSRVIRELQALLDGVERDLSPEEMDRMRAMAAFGEWDHSHRPGHYEIERRAFLAGWMARGAK